MLNLETELIPAPVREIQYEKGTGSGSDSEYRVILYNDDWHGMDEVIVQVRKATHCSSEEAMSIVVEVHLRGRGVCFRGNHEECHRVTRVLREIRLQCEVDCD